MAQSPVYHDAIPQWQPSKKIVKKIEILIRLHHKIAKQQSQLQQILRSTLLKRMPLLSHYIQAVDAKKENGGCYTY